LDSRCPLLHYPPSLASYLAGLPNRKIILVLTKVDISGPNRSNAWSDYLKKRYPYVRIVQVESYVPKELGPNDEGTSKRSRRFEPHLPHTFRERLVQALREVHQELLQPPEMIRGDEVKMKHWKPSVKTGVDWDAVLSAHGDKVGQAIGGPIAPRQTAPDSIAENVEPSDEKQDSTEAMEPDFLTIGLIGDWKIFDRSIHLDFLVDTTESRPTKRWKVFVVKRTLWHDQSSGVKNSWKGMTIHRCVLKTRGSLDDRCFRLNTFKHFFGRQTYASWIALVWSCRILSRWRRRRVFIAISQPDSTSNDIFTGFERNSPYFKSFCNPGVHISRITAFAIGTGVWSQTPCTFDPSS